MSLPVSDCRHIFPGGVSGRLILACEDQLVLFDTSSFQTVSMIAVSSVKRVDWSHDNSMVAVTSGSVVRILDKELKQLCVISEKMNIKNCVWDERGVLLYATLSQIKYCLPSGEKGVVRSLDEPVYIAAYRRGVVFAFTRDAVPVQIEIDPTEYLFKVVAEERGDV